jgi:hypothetical protein
LALLFSPEEEEKRNKRKFKRRAFLAGGVSYPIAFNRPLPHLE